VIKKIPTEMVWNNKLIETFWNGVEKTRMNELNFAYLAGPYLIELIQNELSKDKKYLDYGSGSGEIVHTLAQQGIKIGAYEISEERIRTFHQSVPTEDNDNFLGYISDDDDQLFDTVLMTEVIEHILPEELESTIENIKSKLNPGGTIIITTPNSEDIGLGICYCPTCNHTFHRWQHLLKFTPESLENLMREKGFATKNMHLIDFSMNRFIIEENKFLKKQIEIIKKLNDLKSIQEAISKIASEPGKNSNDLHIGAESHILYIGTFEKP
jgi:2-polyprenyl-3-methyl-5-hydroxy-6-metoxy-1,4-benzoquinol methylase